jgi:TRAP-type C4-dicarboxylate transport system permease small subunit
VVSRTVDRLMGAIERTLAYAFIVAVGLNFVNVVGRYGFGFTILSADELQVFIMIFMAFLGAGVVAWHGQHLRMDVLANALPASMRWALRIVELVVIVVLAGFVLWNSTYYAYQMFNFGRVSDMGQVPMWIPHGAVALGFGLIAFVACLRLIPILTERPVASGNSAVGI